MRLITIFFLLFSFIQTLFSDDLKKISLQLQWKHQFQFAGFYIAKEKGFYKELGLNLNIKEFDSDIDIINEVTSQKATFGTSYPSLILEKSNGKDVVLLNAILQSSPHALITLESSNINSLKDFKDKTLMINKSAINAAPFVSMLQSNNVSFKNIKKVPQTFNIKELIEKKVDISTVFTTNEPYYLNKKDIKYKIWDPKDYGFDFYDVLVFTSSSIANTNPIMVSNFKDATLKGWEYAFSNIEETAELILKKYNTQNRTRDALIYEAKELKKLAYYNNKKLGNIDTNSIQRIFDVYNLLGLTKDTINLDKFIFKSNKNFESLGFTKEEKKYLSNKKFNIYLNNWVPISIYNEERKRFDGLSLDYWNKIKEFIPINNNLIYSNSFLNSLEHIKKDENGIMISLSYTDDKSTYGTFSKPYTSYPIGIATQDKEDFILNLHQLEGKRIAVGKNFSAHKLLKKYYPGIIFVPVKNTIEALELLAKGKVYGAADILLTLKYYLQKYSYTNLKVSGTSDFKFDIQIMVNKKNANLIPLINKAIEKISENDKKLFENKWIQTIKQVEKIDYTLVYIILIVFILIVLFLLWRHKELSKYKNALEEKTKQLNDYVEASTDFVWEVDINGIYTEVSHRVESILGYTPQEMIGKSVFEFMSKNNVEEISEIYKEVVMKKDYIIDLQNQNIHKDGSFILLLTNGVPIFKDGTFVGYRGTDKDITDEKQKDLLILEQSKMVAMGEMIANISHQWRQPLSVISTAATGMKFQKEFAILKHEEFIKSCEVINDNAQYLSKTIDTFKNFIKEDKIVKEHPIETEISQAIDIIKITLKNKYIKLKDNIDYDKKTIIKIVTNELSQAIINIINNSKDIIIERDIPEGWIEINLIKRTNKLIITIEDNGKGIPSNILPRIFEPYFTTKHKSKGTGLGLHISYKIITESLKGNIYVNNTVNGAKFYIEIPR